jgi:hypothetical protein
MATTRILLSAKETEKPTTLPEDEHLELRKEFSFQEIKRGEDVKPVEVKLEVGDVLQFEFDDETVWLCSRDDLGELFDEVALQEKRNATSEGTENAPVLIPTELVLVDQQRGLKKVLVKFLKIFGRKKVDDLPAELDEIIQKLARDFEEKALDKLRGLLGLKRNFTLEKRVVKEEGTYFLFLHGTAASTKKTFGALNPSDNPTDLWNTIFETYGEANVLAFEHESLTKSPLQNVLELVRQLPAKATLHILSQSRGGLIGEILCRFCIEDSGAQGFSDNEKNFLNRAGREKEVKLIEEIQGVMQAKAITIGKFVRVACPANGAILASKRLDVLLNVIFNLIGPVLKENGEVFVAFRNLLAAAVEIKNNPDALPGLEIQNPESPFNQVLNNPAPAFEITAPLLVVSGNNKVGLRWQAIVSILARLFNMGPNDLIVNTRSMFNGAKRAPGRSQYLLDEGPFVNHFNYFANKPTRNAILNAIQSEDLTPVPGFIPLTDRDFTGTEIRNINLNNPKGRLFPAPVSGKKPIVILLPGIMGSNLTVGDQQVWLNFLSILRGELTSLSKENDHNIMAPSVVEASYKKLTDFLSLDYDVVVFPYDWRLSIAQCGEAFNSKVVELLQFKQPIKLIAHSMGGLVIRDFMINKKYRDTWSKLSADVNNFRLLFLGSPLGGSYRIPYILFGEDSIINTVSAIDLGNSKKSLVKVFSQLPGILSLLPLDTGMAEQDFARADTWISMSKAFGDDKWPVPDADSLTAFDTYRSEVLKSKPDYSKAIYIAGQTDKGDQTISGYVIKKRKTFFGPTRETLEFVATQEGDGSVTWASGIPKAIADQKNVYFSDVPHGELANATTLFRAISDLLKTGTTSQLPQTQPTLRGLDTGSTAKANFTFNLSPDNVEKVLLGLGTSEGSFVMSQPPLLVSVSNGHLKYAKYPLLIGHFDQDGILSAEKAVDQLLNEELSKRVLLRLYPGPINTSQYVETGILRDLKGVLVVGLGRQGDLNEFQLISTIELGVSSYLVSLINKPSPQTTQPIQKSKVIGISTLLIGSGYGGLSIESAVRSVLQAVQNANQKVLAVYKEMAKTIEALEFIELYTDRALACVKAVSVLEKEENRILSLKRSGNSINKQPGRRGRLPVEDTQNWWTRINVQPYENPDSLDKKRQSLRFAISTDAARIEEATLTTDSRDLFQILDVISIKDEWTPRLAKVIFEMLLPNDFKQQVKRQNNISWQLDSLTAAFPWELLQDSTCNAKPLSVNAGMIRQLATPNFRRAINLVVEKSALVIADPNLEGFFGQLDGARREGDRIAARLKANGYDTAHSSHQKSAEIRIELLGKDYKIVHLAGHGAFELGPDKKTGMLIGKDSFLTPDDIVQMSGVPELVFVNCCYLGQMAALSDDIPQSPYRLAANIGTRLIEIGVKAVVVAGWAVKDSTALEFAEEFYECLFSGDTFGEAVKRARQAIFDKYGIRNNTWGAYQCYGDPFYRLKNQIESQRYDYTFIIPEEVEIELANLLNQLDTGSYDVEVLQKKMEGIARGMEQAKIENGKIIEYQALLYAGMGMYQEAIEKFESLRILEESAFSFSALEKFCNVRARYAIQKFKKDPEQRAGSLEKLTLLTQDLTTLNTFGCTNERLYLLGSTYKRLGMVSEGPDKQTAYEKATGYYWQTINKNNKIKHYPLTNWLALEYAFVLAGTRKWGSLFRKSSENNLLAKSSEEAKEMLRIELKHRNDTENDEADFWNYIAKAKIMLVLLILDDEDISYDSVLGAYQEVWKFTGHKGKRIGELEHLDFLLDLYSIVPDGKADRIIDFVVRLRRVLEAIG